MQRYQAVCRHCGQATLWQGNREICRDEILHHLHQDHGLDPEQAAAAYELREQRQCDYCLEAFIDSCTKCSRDFCAFHQGDIDGLCGGCI
ncbi:MAG: hypothetical protein C4567_05360 [Deltaproteobacteria bacterium]|nr:MAG: hypothetical protein C4567_05360 [Deltaproteobacteria bacterium]